MARSHTQRHKSTLAQTREITTVVPNNGEELSDNEESILRMRNGIGKRTQAVLTAKTNDPALYEMLLEIELRALEKTGRLHEMLKKTPFKK